MGPRLADSIQKFTKNLTHVGILGCGEASIGALGPPQAKFKQLDVLPSRNPESVKIKLIQKFIKFNLTSPIAVRG